jgi:N-acetylglucosamine-6-sulfatase
VLNVDVAPTLLDLARVKPVVKFHGRSFVPLLREPAGEWRKAMLAEYFLEKVGPRFPNWQAVRTDRWKYIHFPTLDGMDELYDLAADPAEMTNRIHDPAAQTTLKELRGELKTLLEATR